MRRLSLYSKVVLTNGAVFLAGTLALALTPARVSEDVLASEAVVLAVGLTVMVVLNAVLLRSTLRPVDRVIREMATVDLVRPERRLDQPPAGPGAALVTGWNALLDRLEAERAAGAAKALAAQEAERHRIAQDLHDEVGQSLTVVLLGLKRAEDRVPPELTEVAEDLALVRESARAGLDDVRRVARRLRPGVLEDLGLLSALAALANDFTALGRGHLTRTTSPGLPPLSPEAELVVYRVAQEALTNVARHAGATEVGLSLTRVGDAVALEVRDDGHGRPFPTAGSGVLGMRERAVLVGGTLTIDSTPGQGTTVRLAVPV
ncbi:sensor histidine kinase [Nocardioides deserti]|uniref:histidine kinase n=1 Tax=Nocardioides deserti TaxID=1588644 RepID=A0ABR6U8T6_9ACTN|nr:sensor histidine kinase [Nocardioides deserti]MBC2960862.1 sensor histidine kinase [Nocardioides deserti]GGO77603.1 histidine kinase [Nocardioides deserti]